MGKDPLWRVGIAGLARAGIWRRVRQWLALDGVELVAAADPDRDRRARALQMGVPRVYGGSRELLARETLDILHVAGSPLEYGSLVNSALMRGLEILVEPPLAVTAAEAWKLVAASRTYGSWLVPAWPAAFQPSWQGLLVHARQVGRPLHLDAALRLGFEPWWGRLDEEALEDPRFRLPGALELGADRLVHLALELLGMPAEVAAWTERDELFGKPWEPRATVLLLYPWGTARFRLSVGSTGGETRRKRTLPGPVLYGTEGRLVVRGRRLMLERPREEGRTPYLPQAPGIGDDPPRWLVNTLTGPVSLAGSLNPARLGAVYRVTEALERSAAVSGARMRAAEPVPREVPARLQ